jgi:hypothetical protein
MVRGPDPPEWITGHDLFVMQGDERVDASGAARGQQAGGGAGEHGERYHRGERPRVPPRDTPNLTGEESRYALTCEEADEDSRSDQAHAFPKNFKMLDCWAPRAMRMPIS